MGGRVSSPRFVGRSAELAILRDLLDEALAGRPRLALVSGDAGIGKSRLVDEALATPRPPDGRAGQGAAPLRVLIGHCLPVPDGGLPYAPLTEALRQLARETDPEELAVLLGPARGEVARLLPELAGGAPWPLPASPATAGRADQARLFELLLGLLGRLAADAPTILVVEDLHWIDDATRALLTFIARNLQSERLLVVTTFRTDATDAPADLLAWMAELGRSPIVARLELGPLSDGEVAAQLEGILGAAPTRRLAGSIVARSGGNALFAEELLAASRDGDAAALPATLAEVLLARVRGLDGPARDVVRMLAIAGRPVDERLLAAAVGLSDDDLAAGTRSSVERHVAIADSRSGTVSLRHVLLAEAIRDELLAGERRRLNERYAEALTAHPELADASPAGAAGELAAHWAAADRSAEAFATALEAARAAVHVHAHSEAWRQFRRAIDRWDRLAPEERIGAPDLVPLLLEGEEAADLAGETGECEALIQRALGLVDPAVDPRTAGLLHGRLAYHRWLAGRSHEELGEFELAVALVPPEPPSMERARVLRGLAGALMGLGRFRESIAACEAAIEAARAAGAPAEEGRTLTTLGMDLVGLGDVESGIDRLLAARAIGLEHDPVDGLVVALYNLALHLLLVDRTEEAVTAAMEGIEVCRRVGLDRRYGIIMRAVAADALLRLGRWAEADALVAEGVALDPDPTRPIYLKVVGLRLATARGRLDEARTIAAATAPLAEGDVDYDLVAYLRTAEAELAYWDGRLADAHLAVQSGLAALAASDDVFLTAPLLAFGMRVEAERAEAARAWHDDPGIAAATATAEQLMATVDALRARLVEGGRRPAPGTSASLAWVEAEHGRLLGRSDPTAWAAVASAWDELDHPASAAYARIREAEARLSTIRDRDGAAIALRMAATTADALGAFPLQNLAQALARRARLSLEPVSTVQTAETRARRRPLDEVGAPAAAAAVTAEARAAGGPRPEPARVPVDPAARHDGAAPPRGSGEGRARLRALGLSERELEVLALVAAGRTNGQIAAELFISPKTASVHVTHILDKMGAANRVEAASMATRLGLEPAESGVATAPPVAPGRTRYAFLFTDIVRSTALIEAIGDDAWTGLRSWHDATLRRLFTAHDGREVDHAGDGFFVVFGSPASALECAIAIQDELAEHRRTAGFAPAVRIGLHVGDAVRSGSGYTGRDVHLAARLLALVEAGGIVATTDALSAAGRRGETTETVELAGIAGRVGIARLGLR